MARYIKNKEYHKDEITKHRITEEDIQFLIGLQREMNTQDHLGQADPRFWVIRGTEEEYGIEEGFEDNCILCDSKGNEIANDMESAAEYLKGFLEDSKLNVRYGDLYDEITLTERSFEETDEEDHEDGTSETLLLDLDDVCEYLLNEGQEVEFKRYRVKEKIYPDTMFLTLKEAEKHLSQNEYHYSEDAHAYAMTAWRSPEVEKLFKVIQSVDWQNLLQNKEAVCRTIDDADCQVIFEDKKKDIGILGGMKCEPEK